MDFRYEHSEKTLCWQGNFFTPQGPLAQFSVSAAKSVSTSLSERERCIPALQLFGRRCNHSRGNIFCRKWSYQGILLYQPLTIGFLFLLGAVLYLTEFC
jgi:hypothetical protein